MDSSILDYNRFILQCMPKIVQSITIVFRLDYMPEFIQTPLNIWPTLKEIFTMLSTVR